ncbi:MinD-like ATPase involved in chromosome partitioning or flagellar assembly [Curtobacterium sp. PhB130]|uniref:hypothetical protein n=1 Tax=Curtobacterium sp. PhB130 TaxID=2485178 RepID=UPI000F4C1350|nr:hypothetical protein [Curtobacterium sp. PhB130]ROS76323.1 MinD-like ATPase involved in chromosome partitioning or flagellar assembly [Curtobacterium sp. PhB130]
MVDLRDAGPALVRAFFGSTAGGARELDDAHRAIRQGVPTSRRIAFTSLAGGTGCSATAAAVATVLARRRPGRVLGVDGAAGNRSLARYAGTPLEGATPPSALRAGARASWEATDGLALAPSGLHVLRVGGVGPGHGAFPDRAASPERGAFPDRAASPDEWADAVDPIARFFDVVVGDWGRRSPFVDLGAVAEDAHVVALVCAADRAAIEAAVSHADAVRAHATGTEVVVVPVDVTGEGQRAARTAETWDHVRVLPVPHDPAVTDPRRVRSAALRTGLVHLTAALVDAAVDATRRPTGAPR